MPTTRKEFHLGRLISALLICASASLLAAGNPALALKSTRPSDIFAPREVRESLTAYHDPTSNFDFDYPRSWQVVADPDKDSLFKISGTTSEGKYGEVKLSVVSSFHDSLLAMNMMEHEMAEKLPQYQKLEERKVRFGSRYQYTGDESKLRFSMGDMSLSDRMIFFADSGSVYCCSFICSAGESSSMEPLFDKILSSLHRTQTAHSKPTLTPGGPSKQIWKLVNYTDKTGQVAIGYPDGWHFVNNDPGKELDIKFRGRNDKGFDSELYLSRIDRPPTMSLEQFADFYEQTYLKALANFKCETTHRTTFGISRNDGLVHYCTFSVEGHPGRQANAFFAEGKHYYCVALNTVAWTEPEARDLFERVLSTIKVSE